MCVWEGEGERCLGILCHDARFWCSKVFLFKGFRERCPGLFFFFSRTRYIDFLKEILCLGILS